MEQKKKHIGSDLDDFLKEIGILDEVEAIALERIIEAKFPMMKEIYAYGLDLFKDKNNFIAWLKRPARAFKGKRPIDFIDTENGIKQIMDELKRIEYGVYMSKGLTQHQRDILDSEFPDAKVEYDRTTIEKYSRNVRDFRLASGRYYTPTEMEERAKKAFAVKL